MTRFLLTNDDGIDAPGIQVLARSLDALGGNHELHWAAPNCQYSGCGHPAIAPDPIRVEPREKQPATSAHAVFSSPASCTRLGVRALAPGVDWVISGVNAGGNLGIDQFFSGTVAGARQAVMDGIPAIALSHYIDSPKPIHWPTVERWTTAVLRELLGRSLPKHQFWSVNFPHLAPDSPLPELVFCDPSRDGMDLRFQETPDGYVARSVYRDRPVTPGSDVEVCFNGKVAITRLSI